MMLQVDEGYNGKEIKLPVGQTFEIRLSENRTAGYSWKLIASGEPTCVLIEDSFEAAVSPPGRPGVHRWLFRAEKSGSVSIQSSYSRPWEGIPTQTFSLQVHVE